MPKVSVSFGVTFKEGNDFYKLNQEISEIETSLPLAPQIEEVRVALDAVWDEIKKKIDVGIEKVVGRKSG